MTTATLVPLPHKMAQWRIEKLPLAEIKQRLQAACLQAVGTKRTLSTRLCQHLRTLPPPAQPQPGATEESSDQSEGATTATDAVDSEAVDTDQAAASGAAGGHDTPPGRVQRGDCRRRRPRSRQSLSARDMRAVKDLLRRHSRRRPPTARSSRFLPLLQLHLVGRHFNWLEHHRLAALTLQESHEETNSPPDSRSDARHQVPLSVQGPSPPPTRSRQPEASRTPSQQRQKSHEDRSATTHP